MQRLAEQRVAITGMGAVSALGNDATSLWDGLKAGRSGIASLVHPRSTDLRVNVAAQVRDFDPSSCVDARTLTLLDRLSQFALVAATEAIRQAALSVDSVTKASRVAVVIGTGIGGEISRDEESRKLYAEGAARVHPLSVVRAMPSAPVSHIAMAFGAKGPSFGVTSACASSNHAIAQAAMLIRAGVVDVAIAGGTEACLSFAVLRAWEAMRVLADDTCRPFSLRRRGLVLGEGAGIFVLESLAHARKRDHPILAELAGIGMSSDAADIVAPSADGASRAMLAALDDAGLAANEIDHINAHGTGTAANDVTETAAIQATFGGHATRIAVTSTKSMHGHALGAAGALELVATIGALREGIIPPTINFLEADPACALDVVTGAARSTTIRSALSNSFAFGGLNAVLALRSMD